VAPGYALARIEGTTVELELSAQDRAFLDEFRAWLRANRPRRSSRRLRSQEPGGEGRLEALRAWQRTLHAAGYLGIAWPREYGGRDGSPFQQMLVNEELARQRTPGIVGLLGVRMLGPTLLRWGSDDQKRRFLRRILTAEDLWCQGYSEPGSGSDLASLQTRAVREGDEFVVTGQKIWTTNAHFSDWMFALVRTNPDAPKHRGISYLLIDMRTPGIEVRPLVQMTRDAGFNQVFFDRVRVPVENLVGDVDQGWGVAHTTLSHERDMLGASTHTQMLFDGVLRLARRVKRRGRPVIQDPAIRRRLAELKIRVEAMRFHSYRTLTDALRGRPGGVAASVTKLNTTWLNHHLAELALDLLGSYGTLYGGSRHLVEDGFWTHEFMFTLGMIIGGGTSQIQRNIVAQRGLGLPRSA
jgi:alkylation response protein AidB-like acyl-CoA dehydrogenase